MSKSGNGILSSPGSRKSLGVILKFVIPVVISVGLCWLLFHDDNLYDMLVVIDTKCDFKWIGLMLVFSFVSYIARAMRWGIQLEGVGVNVSKRDLVYSIFGTYAVNLVLPRLGEVWRSGFIAHRTEASFSMVFGSMLADRFADIITALLFAVITFIVGHGAIIAFLHRYPDGYRFIAELVTSPWFILSFIAMVLLLVLFFKSRSSNVMVNRIKGFCRQLWHGFSAILVIKRKGMWLLWTITLWGCYFIEMVLAFQAFPFTREIFAQYGLVAVLVCFTLGTIAMGIPSNGGIGPYQIAIIFGLSLYCPSGVDECVASTFDLDSKAFANLVLSMSTGLTIILGLWTFIAIAIGKKKFRNR